MRLAMGDDPFRMWIRREEGYESTCTVRFETEHGRAVLGIQGLGEADATSHFEGTGIKLDALRGGRLVHVLPGGQRRSYALSRLTPEVVDKLPSTQWVELEPVTEYGFRYLVFPKELPLDEAPRVVAPSVASASAASSASAPSAPGTGASAAAPRPAPVAKASAPSPTSSSSAAGPVSSGGGALPPRQTPMAPELAMEALSQLSPQAAVQHLKLEMAKVDALHKRVEELERRLAASQEREQDLLELLQKWQSIV
jgi:hypothetical protein